MTKSKNLFLYAIGREAEFQLGNNSLTLMNQPKSAATKSYSRITSDDRLITIEAESNNLCVTDLQSRRVIQQLQGYKDAPYQFEKFRPFRYAKEDQYPIWKKGGSSLAILNPTNFQQKAEFQQFWPNGYTPMFACASPIRNKILGYSIQNRESTLTVLHLGNSIQNSPISQIRMNPQETWVGMELTTQGDVLIAAVQTGRGSKNPQDAYMKLCAFNVPSNPQEQQLTMIFQKNFTQPAFKRVQMLKKIKGYDIYMLACSSNLAFIIWNGQDFVILNLIQNIYNGIIFDSVLCGNVVIPISTDNNDVIKVFSFNKQEFDSVVRADKSPENSQLASKIALKFSVLLNQSVTVLQAPYLEGPKRIAVSKDGRTVYFGGEGGLAVLKRPKIGMPFEVIKKDQSINFYALKPTPSGHFVVQLCGSNNLAVYDKNCKLKVDFNGERYDNKWLSVQRSPHFSFEDDQIIWFGGSTSLYIIDLKSLAQIKIENFAYEGESGSPPQPMNAVADFSRQKFLVHYKIEREDVLIYHINGREPDPRVISEVLPKFDNLKCLEINEKRIYVFAGGDTSELDQRTGAMKRRACISALRFDRELKTEAEILLPTSKCSTVHKILCSSRHQDVIYVATDGPLFIIGFSGSTNEFEVIKAININVPNSKRQHHKLISRYPRRHVSLRRRPFPDEWSK